MLTLLVAVSAAGAATASSVVADGPPVQIWMNNDRRFREGDRVRLQIDAEVDGFLLVLNYEPDGRIRVLFPLDPRDDSRVRAGRRYEVRDQGGETAFRAGPDGTGLVYSAISPDPWRFDDIVQGDRWDYDRLTVNRASDNPEADLTELVQPLAGSGGFDYDVAEYRVYGVTTTTYASDDYAYDDYYSRGPIYVYNDYSYCNGWYGCYDCCFRSGWSISFGFGSYGYGYWPYRYGYYPYRYGYYPYGYYSHGYYPYYPYRPSFPVGHGPVIAGRPRSYTIFPRTGIGTASGTRFGSGTRGTIGTSGRTGSLPPINWRPRSVARPAGDRGSEITRGSDQRGVVMPPARRARSDNPGGGVPGVRNDGARGRPSNSEPRARGNDARGRPSSPEPRARGEGARGRPSYSEPRARSDDARGRPSYSEPGVRSDVGRGRPSYSEPRARSDDARGRLSYSEPRVRSDVGRGRPSYSEPRARSDDGRSRGNYAPPARVQPRSYSPPPRSEPSNRGGGGGGGVRASGGGGGGHSRPSSSPSRSRRP